MDSSQDYVNKPTQPAKGAGKETGGVFILCEDYNNIYSKTIPHIPGQRRMSYNRLSRVLYAKSFFYGDAFSDGFKKEGLASDQCVPHCTNLQERWARENNIGLPPTWLDKFLIRGISRRLFNINFPSKEERSFKITTAQIKKARPRLLWVFSGIHVTKEILDEWRKYTEKIVLWHSCPLWPDYPFESYDAIFSCIQPLVEHFRGKGIKSFLLPHAFDTRILDVVKPDDQRKIKAVFVGCLGGLHKERTAFFDQLARNADLDYFGPGIEGIALDSPLRKNYKGPVWGNDLYKVYGSYLLALHANINVAGGHPSAKRLFETTGMGACLVTNYHEKLSENFIPEEEVVTFKDLDDCIEKIRSLLKNPEKAAQIGRQAQARTIKDHTYNHRIKTFLNICREELGVRF